MNDLIERLRSEAEIADRPGQYDRLNALADEFAAALEAVLSERDALKAENDRLMAAINRCQGGSLIACCISF